MAILIEQDSQTILDEIVNHVLEQGGPPTSWYAGITSDINERVFGTHNVPREGHWRIHRKAISSREARDIEQALLNWGCDGGPGGGDNDAVYVYAYLKTAITNP